MRIDCNDVDGVLDNYNDFKLVDITDITNDFKLVATVTGAFSDTVYYIKENANDKILYRKII